MPPVPQGRHGYLSIGGTKYPSFNVRYTAPRGIIVPTPVGNTWVTHHAEGLQTSRVVAQFELREKTTELLAASFWNLFLNRTWSGGFDDTGSFTLVAASGRRTYTMANTKAESFQVVVASGSIIALNAVFIAPAPGAVADSLAVDYSTISDESPPLMFDRATFSGITGPIYGLEFTYANNHQPNAPLNGTKFLTSWDAGIKSCGARLTVPEHVAAQTPITDDTTFTCALAGNAVTRTFSFTAPVANNPNDLDILQGQLFKAYDVIVKGTSGTPPLVVT